MIMVPMTLWAVSAPMETEFPIIMAAIPVTEWIVAVPAQVFVPFGSSRQMRFHDRLSSVSLVYRPLPIHSRHPPSRHCHAASVRIFTSLKEPPAMAVVNIHQPW